MFIFKWAYFYLASGRSGQQSSRMGALSEKSSWTPDVIDPSVDFDLTALVERICFERMEDFLLMFIISQLILISI